MGDDRGGACNRVAHLAGAKMTLSAELIELVDALGQRFEQAFKHGLSKWVDPALLKGEVAEASTSPSSRHVELQIALGTVFEWRLLGMGGKTLWVVENGSSSLEVAFDRQPSSAERGQPMPTGTRIRGRWDRVYVRMRTAGTGTARIILYNDDIDVSIANPVTGGTPISVSEALPVYLATPTTTTESAAPVYLSTNGGTSSLYAASGAGAPPASNALMPHVVARPQILTVTRNNTGLGASATYNGTLEEVGTNTDGLASGISVGAICTGWITGTALCYSNVAGTLRIDQRITDGGIRFQNKANDTTDGAQICIPIFSVDNVRLVYINGGSASGAVYKSFALTNVGAGVIT